MVMSKTASLCGGYLLLFPHGASAQPHRRGRCVTQPAGEHQVLSSPSITAPAGSVRPPAPDRRKPGTPRAMPLLAALLTLCIFVTDTFSPLNFTVAVLYVIVVVMAAGFCSRRGLLAVSAGCVALTLLSYMLTHKIGRAHV